MATKAEAQKLQKKRERKIAHEFKVRRFAEAQVYAVSLRAQESVDLIAQVREGITGMSKKLQITKKESVEITKKAWYAYVETLFVEALRPQKRVRK